MGIMEFNGKGNAELTKILALLKKRLAFIGDACYCISVLSN